MLPRTSRLTEHYQSGDDGLTKCVRLFRYLGFSCFYALLRDEDRKLFYSLSLNKFSQQPIGISKKPHTVLWSILPIRGCVHLPLQQVFNIIMSPDSTFYKLYSDILMHVSPI